MRDILCGKEYKKFFEALQDNIYDIESMLQRIQEAIPLIAGECHLGKLDIWLGAPVTVYEPEGKNDSVELYCHAEGYENEPQVEEFVTGERGAVRVTAYPEKGHKWSGDEQEAIRFLAQNMFIFCGRARLMGLMKKAVMTDNMTGAVNTAGLMQFGAVLQAKGQLENYTGIFLNIKNFKYINQRAGARLGDEILKKYCFLVKDFLTSEEIFSRLGGDNFFVMIQNERLGEFLEYLSNVTISVEDGVGTKSFDIVVRAGIYPIEPGDTMSEVMNGSTVALNVARSSVNHDLIWYRPKMLEKVMHDKEVSTIFPKALGKREFVIFYQPKVSLAENKLCGCEALVRWVRDGKIIPPMEFIPVLENEGAICRLDFYVLEEVCRDIRKWLDRGIEPVRVSTNFSKIHLHNRQLAEDIISILEKYDIDSKYIEVELTEMSGYEDYEALSSFVNRMKEKGINTSIDDFGTGYSSLNLLKDLNVDIIKLDKSFLNNLENKSRTDEIVIKNIINMVNELNMEVIAEGVETVEQAEFLKNVNCCMAQGFLFDRPLPHDDFEKRLLDRVYIVKEGLR